MRRLVFILIICLDMITAVYINDYDEESVKQRMKDLQFEPVVSIPKHKEKMVGAKNIDCEDFSTYTRNCTIDAALMYNSTRKTPPLPAKMLDWCKAIKHLTNCAIDWNADCKDVTDSHFNEESIKGHMHVVENVCDDEWFLTRYDDIPLCIEATADIWESCYSTFKFLVDEQKNTTHEWTHFETHFYLCCARAQFRRCTLDSLFESKAKCSHEQAVTLQKFSVIVSEGDVYQDCDRNMLYANCPGGDPRPNGDHLQKMMSLDSEEINTAHVLRPQVFLYLIVFNY